VDKKIIHEQKKEIHKATANPVPLKLKTVKMTSHISVVDHPDVDETPPSLDELNHAVIGQAAQPGAAANQDAVQSVAGKGENGAGTAVPDNNIYDAAGVDSYPEFEGGMAAWAKFLQHNLKYPGAAQEEGIQGKVFVSFVIETDGSVSNVTIIKGIGAGCDEEALRVIKKSPKWKPGQQQNKSVRVRYTIPLAFTLN
jgi:protein TonB